MIFIAGPHNSGKTTLAKWLVNSGYVHIETGDIVRKKHKEFAPESDFHDWACRNNEKNPDFLNECILEAIINARKEILNSQGRIQDIIVTGNRQIDGINFIVEKLKNDLHREKFIIYLDAPIEELYQRQLKREDRIIASLTFEKFKDEYLAFDKKMGLENIKKYADCIIDSGKENSKICNEISSILRER